MLIEGFESPSAEVRLLAIDLVNPESDTEMLVPHLRPMLVDPNEQVRLATGWELERIQETRNK